MDSSLFNSEARRHVRLGKERVRNIADSSFPGHYPRELNHWDLDLFRQLFNLSINSLSNSAIEFDLVGVDTSFANAVRRILIAEVPTVAVEDVYIWNNTSIIHDEVLAQRLGLVPLAINPRNLRAKASDEDPRTDLNTIVFNLVVRCEERKESSSTEPHLAKAFTGTEVLSSHFEFDPKGGQSTVFADQLPRAVSPNILIAKMRENQEIVAELHCIKGTGKMHAKWSPVGGALIDHLPKSATASYRLLPTISINAPIPPHHLTKFQQCFPPGVIDISSGSAVVADARRDTVSREVLRHPEFADKVSLGRVRDHFIFSVESAGQYPPQDLVPESLKVLLAKIRHLQHIVSNV